jgi:ABC-type transport system substrate-binding protein
VELARSAAWWGSPEGLGPALDAVRFVRARTAAERVRLLAAGDAQVVEPLDDAGLSFVADDPLLDSETIDGIPVGLEASVRGLESRSAVPLLSGVWLTRIGG